MVVCTCDSSLGGWGAEQWVCSLKSIWVNPVHVKIKTWLKIKIWLTISGYSGRVLSFSRSLTFLALEMELDFPFYFCTDFSTYCFGWHGRQSGLTQNCKRKNFRELASLWQVAMSQSLTAMWNLQSSKWIFCAVTLRSMVLLPFEHLFC